MKKIVFLLLAGLSLSVSTQKAWPYPSEIPQGSDIDVSPGCCVLVGGTVLSLGATWVGLLLLSAHHTAFGIATIATSVGLECLMCTGCCVYKCAADRNSERQYGERLLGA